MAAMVAAGQITPMTANRKDLRTFLIFIYQGMNLNAQSKLKCNKGVTKRISSGYG